MIKITKTLIAGIILLASLYSCKTQENQTAKEMQKIEKSVTENAEKQYRIAKRSGSPMDAYVHAGIVAAAYLHANDEINYKNWKHIENREAKIAGISTE